METFDVTACYGLAGPGAEQGEVSHIRACFYEAVDGQQTCLAAVMLKKLPAEIIGAKEIFWSFEAYGRESPEFLFRGEVGRDTAVWLSVGSNGKRLLLTARAVEKSPRSAGGLH